MQLNKLGLFKETHQDKHGPHVHMLTSILLCLAIMSIMSHFLLLHCICVTPLCAPRGENDLFLKQFTQHEIMFDMLTFVRSAIHHHSPLLTPLLSTGQLGQHQHHPAVLPWSPPAVSRGIKPGGWAGGPAGVQSSRWVGTCETQGTL